MIRMRRKTPANNQRRRGVTSVEFALCAPILFLFFFAQLEFTRANMLRNALRTSCYEGCREGIIVGSTSEDIEAAATRNLKAIGFRKYDITVTPSVITDNTREVTVKISAPIAENSWYPPFFLRGVSIDNSMTMERELVDQLIF